MPILSYCISFEQPISNQIHVGEEQMTFIKLTSKRSNQIDVEKDQMNFIKLTSNRHSIIFFIYRSS